MNCIEMGGRDVKDADHRVTETTIRAFWDECRELMGCGGRSPAHDPVGAGSIGRVLGAARGIGFSRELLIGAGIRPCGASICAGHILGSEMK